jgi:hypothetical protein
MLCRGDRHVVPGQTTRVIVVMVFGLSVYISYGYTSNGTRANIPGQSIAKVCVDLPIIDDAADDPILGDRVLEGYLGDR